MLLKRLSGLSLKETKMLLYKYFKKCIDMRDGGRQLAAQLAQQDVSLFLLNSLKVSILTYDLVFFRLTVKFWRGSCTH